MHRAAITHVLFSGFQRVSAGHLSQVAVAARRHAAEAPEAPLTVIDRESGRVVDLDLRGSDQEVAARYSPQAAPARGRPRLGVVPREVTLLPRHWDWLAAQPGGASAALRRLVDQARKTEGDAGERRSRRDAVYRFLSAVAGDLPGFEGALRALYRDDDPGFITAMEGFPPDVRAEAAALLRPVEDEKQAWPCG